jgi:hypothetical protein
MDPQGAAALHHHRSLHAGGKNKKTSPGTGQLSYFIFEGVLTGVFGKDQIYITAWSGGAGGSKKLKPTDDANNPYSYGVKEVSDPNNPTRGGPYHPVVTASCLPDAMLISAFVPDSCRSSRRSIIAADSPFMDRGRREAMDASSSRTWIFIA